MPIGNLHRIFGVTTSHPRTVLATDYWRCRIESLNSVDDRALVVALKRIVFIVRLAVWRSEIYWV